MDSSSISSVASPSANINNTNKTTTTSTTSTSSCNNNNVVRVGIGVVVMNTNRQIYAGIRRSSHGSGKLALPGGHLEMYETWEECAIREVYEEMNIQLNNCTNDNDDDDDNNNIQFLHVLNDIMSTEEKHYVEIVMICTKPIEVIPMNMEPNKCDGWVAYTWDELQNLKSTNPDHFFSSFLQLIQNPPPKLLQALGV